MLDTLKEHQTLQMRWNWHRSSWVSGKIGWKTSRSRAGRFTLRARATVDITYLMWQTRSSMLMIPLITTLRVSLSTTLFSGMGTCNRKVSVELDVTMVLDDMLTSQTVPVIPYVDYWADLFNLNETFSAAVHAKADSCGYTDYFNTYLTFPPPAGPFPSPTNSSNDCDVFDDVFSAVLEINPCFNIYHITDTCPHLFNVLGIVNQGDYFPPGAQVYFNRTDVQAAINAPIGTNWMQCTNKNVFTDATPETTGEMSVAPAQDGVLKHVIESTNNTIIGVGDLDYLLPTNGTLMALQNLTWNGVQGFQVPPTNNFYVPYHPEYNLGALAGAGDLGVWVSERGLTFYTVYLSGHGKFYQSCALR